MNDLGKYLAVRGLMQPGDVIVCWGNGVVSKMIEMATGGPSHVGMVRLVIAENGVLQVQMAESTIENGRSGAQTVRLSTYLGDYDGSVSLLTLLPEKRAKINWAKFYAFIERAENPATQIRYDIPGLFGFIGRSIPLIGSHICQSENLRQMFCSGYDTAIYEESGVLLPVNASEISPLALCQLKLFSGNYPLVGNPPTIKGFNTVDPDKFLPTGKLC